jgi:hypothetical protein
MKVFKIRTKVILYSIIYSVCQGRNVGNKIEKLKKKAKKEEKSSEMRGFFAFTVMINNKKNRINPVRQLVP